MRPLYKTLLVAFVLAIPMTRTVAQESVVQHSGNITLDNSTASVPEGMRRFYNGSALDCPDSTVFSNPFDASAGMKSCNRSDQAYQNGQSCVYVPFSGNRNLVSGIQVFATFEDNQFRVCDNRVALDDDKNWTEPIRVAVSFWKTGSDGTPSTLVQTDTVDVVGVQTGAQWNDGDGQNSLPIYALTVNFSEKMKLENGWVSFCAVDDGTIHDCCFCLISHSNSTGGLNKFTDAASGQTAWYGGSFCYCFLGDADEFIAKKGLKLNSIVSPIYIDNSRYAKVQVCVNNYGEDDINDATLALYLDGKLISTETIDDIIYSGWDYRYTFKARVDLSEIGEHELVVYNITPNDDMIADEYISTTTETSDEVCYSSSSYNGKWRYITHVGIGDISNDTDWSLYSDYRDMKTNITAGETLKLNVEMVASNGYYVKVWVDWNGDGLFNGDGEFMGYASSGSLDIKIPEGISATPGDKCMRIILSNSDCLPYGYYTYGETEDYTLTVTRADSDAAVIVDTDPIDCTVKYGDSTTRTLSIANEGAADLSLNVSAEYYLPSSPDVSDISKAPARLNAEEMPALTENNLPQKVVTARSPEAPEGTQYVLKYGGEFGLGVGASATYVNFAHFYPAAMLKNLEGMQITSIDVYIADVAKKSYVAIWKSLLQNYNGEAIVKQQFKPKANSWNHIELDSPVTISGEALFVGVALEGCHNITNQVGLDNTDAQRGFGDLVSTSNSNFWWSLYDLGYNRNVLLRANVSGERTAAINWLQFDKSDATLTGGETAELNATLNTTGLTEPFYEATINIQSNDPLAQHVKIPVYLTNDIPAGIVSISTDSSHSSVYIDGEKTLHLQGGETAETVRVYTVSGRLVATGHAVSSLSMANQPNGLYLVQINHKDGSTSSEAVILK